MIHNYKAEEIATCLNHSRVLYIGDSIMREQFYSMNKLTHSLDIEGPLHIDRKYISEKHGLVYEFWWDPYINQTRTIDLLKGQDTTGDKPSLLVIGSGIWYERRLSDDTYLDEWKRAVDRVFDGVQSTDTIADAVMLSPVEIPQFDRLNADRQRLLTLDKTTIMNNYLHQRELSVRPKLPFAVAFVWNTIATSTVNITLDGLHYLSPVTTPQAQIALNYRCNQQLPKHYPIDTTCCIIYPSPRWYQSIFFVLFLVWVPLGFFFIDSTKTWIRRLCPSNDLKTLTSIFIFGLGVLYMYMGDRTQLFSKMHKDFDPVTFTIQMLCVGLIGLISMTRQPDEEGDQGFLNRGQTDEWKGWMQLVILVYHFTGASGTPGIYNVVRSLVAAYLFQTGYGHFFFFYKKKDFDIARFLNVMVRLNLLTFVLMYLMNTDYLSYYFTPLVSLWFLVIWITMYVGHSYNHKVWFLLIKMVVMCVLTTTMIHVPGVLETTFDILSKVANIHWHAAEWRFRLGLDAYIVYVGMLFALVTIKIKEHKIVQEQSTASFFVLKWVTVCIAALSMIWYFWFELQQPNKQAYNARHPYISWIPILAFILLRNATLFLRNTQSRFFMWIGKCSLETFIGQFHMWLAADTKGLLVVIPSDWIHHLGGTDWGWWLNFVISSILFLCICDYLSQATGTLTGWICRYLTFTPTTTTTTDTNSKDEFIVRDHGDYQAVPLLATRTSSEMVDKEEEEVEDMLSLEEEMNTWQPTPSRWKRWATSVWYDARFKSIVFILVMTLVNHLC
ncbi:10 TM acyl transferase domain found in Cas1p-domain-containing protein [Halteromyces radiatus]|uniref:10 TM acyl transferase domain found in Cas1p-domain-containing protein n=1 Tax=Halteromyces radiatus TaxID=101107 RepID=UPI00221FCFC0|nr:10 TM acyl transferase domain found in Cas1p-domain-containing protein [Halteromyces radiatus]KAI8089980.1 10 TM acyl transferase domain found in Cas1p-domain-containing protein [Halteromyces radiatus]